MLKRPSSATLIIALLLSLGITSAFARNSSADGAEPDAVTMPTNSGVTKAESSRKLRGSVEHLVAEAKAGRPIAERPQIQPAQSNGLSTKTKVLIGAAIAATVITIIVIKHKRDNNFMTIALF